MSLMHPDKRHVIALLVVLILVSSGLLVWRFNLVPEIGEFFAAGSPNMQYVGYYYALGAASHVGAHVAGSTDFANYDSTPWTNLSFVASVNNIIPLKERGVKSIFMLGSIWGPDGEGHTILLPDWRTQLDATINELAPFMNQGLWGIYIRDEPYGNIYTGTSDLDQNEWNVKAQLEEVIAYIKRPESAIRNLKTMITNSCDAIEPTATWFQYSRTTPLTPPPVNLDVYSVDCYDTDPQIFVNRYNEIKNYPASVFSGDFIFTVESFVHEDGTSYSLTRNAQEAWTTRIRAIAGTDPRFIGVLWFLWPSIGENGLQGASYFPAVRAYHEEVGRQVLCSNTWENVPVCGANGTTYPNPDKAKCANTTIASYGSCAATNRSPIGSNDGIQNTPTTITGWAYDPDESAESIEVHAYFDGNPGCTDGCLGVPGIIANISRPDVNQAHNITGNHGFSFEVPAQLRDGQQHTVNIWTIDSSGDGTKNAPADGNPKTFTIQPVVTTSPSPSTTTTPTPPVINSFTATPSIIDAGQTVTLSWDIDNATLIEITHVLYKTNPLAHDVGVAYVSPTTPTTYTIRATRGSTVVTRDVTVTVGVTQLTPVINLFVADPSTITPGQGSRIIWDIDNATTIAMPGAYRENPPAHSVEEIYVYPTITTTFPIIAIRGNIEVMKEVTVTVIQPTVTTTPPPVINLFTATPSSITAGETVTLGWNIDNANTIEIVDVTSKPNALAHDVGVAYVNPTTPTTYTIRAIQGSTVTTRDVMVTVTQPTVTTTPVDVCPNITGNQLTIPEGYILNFAGNCIKRGDVNGDTIVDILDYNALIAKFGNTTNLGSEDIIINGKVDIYDYNALVLNLGR